LGAFFTKLKEFKNVYLYSTAMIQEPDAFDNTVLLMPATTRSTYDLLQDHQQAYDLREVRGLFQCTAGLKYMGGTADRH
jgi:hypothetical protein